MRDRLMMLLLGYSPDPMAFRCALLTVLWGLWVGSGFGRSTVPPVLFSAQTFGVLMIGIGLGQICGIFGPYQRLHRWCAFGAGVIWLWVMAGAMTVQDGRLVSVLVYADVAAWTLWTWWRYRSDPRLRQPHVG